MCRHCLKSWRANQRPTSHAKHELNMSFQSKPRSYELELRNWEIQYNALHEELSLLIFQKDEEIDHLQRSLLKQSPRNNWMWAAGGAVSAL